MFTVAAVFQMNNVSDEEMQEHYDQFFEDVFVECEDKVSFINHTHVRLVML